EHANKIITDGKGQYQLAQADTIVEGIFKANDKGFGFVKLDDENVDDVFIAAYYTKYAVDGDRVKVKIVADGNPWNGKGPEGRIEEILERGLESLVGEHQTLTDDRTKIGALMGYGLSNNNKLDEDAVYVAKHSLITRMGDMVKVSIKDYPEEDYPVSMTGAVTKIIGNKNEPGVDI